MIGRTKPDSIELDDDVKPATAHIARVVIEEDGEELEIYRRSVPYGTVDEHGLCSSRSPPSRAASTRCSAACSARPTTGCHDRLTDFTRPVTGAYYFVPVARGARGRARLIRRSRIGPQADPRACR